MGTSKTINRFPNKNISGQEKMSPKTKNPKLSTSYSMPGEALLKKQRRDKDLPLQTKAGRFHYHQTCLYKKC